MIESNFKKKTGGGWGGVQVRGVTFNEGDAAEY